MTGSSPLARGTLQRRALSLGCRRLIPARAGNTCPMQARQNLRSAHPRSRGEHPSKMPLPSSVSGSSPLARGTQLRLTLRRMSRRLIPARAGNTSAAHYLSATLSAHPRSRGEHLALPITAVSSVGSSPLARGTRSSCRSLSVSFRLIPARAGNTAEAGTAIVGWTAHPRSRGEHRRRRLLCALASGSSPLARGTRVHLFLYDLPRRLIPARAGNTFGLGSARPSLPAHPRSRGEHVDGQRLDDVCRGSSPLARGTRFAVILKTVNSRLIPARAGNTPTAGKVKPHSTAHPRSRGEHLVQYAKNNFPAGSSPLARGTPR